MEDQQPREGMLLYVGRWYAKSGDSQTWALATTNGINYYSGKHGRVCIPVQHFHRTRIYHDYPFDRMFVTQGLHATRDQTHSVKESVVEAVINFAFLLTGRIDYVKIENKAGAEMLSKFKFACTNLHRPRNMDVAQPSLPIEARVSEASEIIPERESEIVIDRKREPSFEVISSKRVRTCRDADTNDTPPRKYL